MWNAMVIAIIIVLAAKWMMERIRFKALIYYLVEKEYTAPTMEELEQCISTVVKKTLDDIIKK